MLTGDTAAFEFRAVERLTGFAGFLRNNGFTAGGGDAVEVLRTAERVGILDESVLRWSLQALLCGRSEEWRRFEPEVDLYVGVADEQDGTGVASLGEVPAAPDARHGDDGMFPKELEEQAPNAGTFRIGGVADGDGAVANLDDVLLHAIP